MARDLIVNFYNKEAFIEQHLLLKIDFIMQEKLNKIIKLRKQKNQSNLLFSLISFA